MMPSLHKKWLSSPGLIACFLVSFVLLVVYQLAERTKFAASDVFVWKERESGTGLHGFQEKILQSAAILAHSGAGDVWNETSLIPATEKPWVLQLRREVQETKESVQKVLDITKDFKSLLQGVLKPQAIPGDKSIYASQSQMDEAVSRVVHQVSTALEDSHHIAVDAVRQKMESIEKLVVDAIPMSHLEKDAAEDCPHSPPSPRTLMWHPQPGKFLLTTCMYQQMSNRLGCIRATMIYAAVLNRTMIFPYADATDRKYNYSIVLNVEHARKCLLGNASQPDAPPIVTLEEYLASHNGRLEVKKIRCWRKHCQMRETKAFDMEQYPTVVFPKRSEYWPLSGVGAENVMTTQDFLKSYDVEDDVLVMGDVFNTRLTDYFNVSSPFVQQCKTLFQPHPAIMEAATGFIRTFLGPDFMAAHWRRGDFFSYCKGCFHSVQETAHCLRGHASRLDLRVLYLATNAEEDEVDLLRELLNMPLRTLSLVRLPPGDLSTIGPWAESLRQLNHEKDLSLIRLTLDRTICALSRVFLSTRGSTFSAEVRGFRSEMERSSCHDKMICPQDVKDIWTELRRF